MMQYTLATVLLYLVDQIILKLSLAVFFLRIVQHRWQKITIYVATTIYTVYTFSCKQFAPPICP